MPDLDMDSRLPFGKHQCVIEDDPQYLKWEVATP